MKYSEICRQREIEARQQAEYYERIPEDAQKAAGAREQREIEAYWRTLAEEAAEEELNHQTKGEHTMKEPITSAKYIQHGIVRGIEEAVRLNSPIEGEPDDELLFPDVVDTHGYWEPSTDYFYSDLYLADGRRARVRVEIIG